MNGAGPLCRVDRHVGPHDLTAGPFTDSRDGSNPMSTFWGLIGYLLYVYVLVILARFVVEATRQFARRWRPSGVAAIGVEMVYLATDPPIRLLRRLVPPIRLGSVSLDLSIMILLIGVLALQAVARSLA